MFKGMKYRLLLLLVVVVSVSAIIDLKVDTEGKKHDLVFLSKVRNYMTHDNQINDAYVRQVYKECWNTPDNIVEENIKECSTEKETPEKTALFLYTCIVKTTKEDHIEDNGVKRRAAGLCQLKLINFIKDGKINKEVVKQKMIAEGEEEADAAKVVEKCSEDKNTAEETANNFIVCLAQQYAIIKK